MAKLLIIDDDNELLKATKELFESLNSDLIIKTISSSKDAQTLLKMEKFDLVITDFEMPEMDGIQLINSVINDSNHKFLVFSGNKQMIQLNDSIRSNVYGIYDKLSETNELIEKTRELLNI